MWTGHDWVSSLPEDTNNPERRKGLESGNAASTNRSFEGQMVLSTSGRQSLPITEMNPCNFNANTSPLGEEDAEYVGSDRTKEDRSEDHYLESSDKVPLDIFAVTKMEISESKISLVYAGDTGDSSRIPSDWHESKTRLNDLVVNPERELGCASDDVDNKFDCSGYWLQAVALSKSTPPGPVFQHQPKRLSVQRRGEEETRDLEVGCTKDTLASSRIETVVSGRKVNSTKSTRKEKLKGIREDYLIVVPKGSLGVDELANLLA
ncbi:hypothetical protein CQW23_12322 [Capsicum baccatum]|uniref:Uncharacterized protein n=1 Tax=Capsicum baccatum TaxID=33114 RepID=A0A2G2WS97_CAPBA|nr:hypothetical protein CQW23_12322 [Capsicum baccatum]